MTYVKASVRRPAGNPGNGIQPKDQLVIYDVDDILSFPQRNEAGVVIEDDIVMKEGRYAIGIYLTPGTAEISSNSDGETDAEGYTPSIKFNHPGNQQEIRRQRQMCIRDRVILLPLSSIIPVTSRKSVSLKQTGLPRNVSLCSAIVAESLPI